MMPISDYVVGIPLRFHSPLPVETLAGRINSSSKSVLNPFALSVTGYVRFGRVMLENRSFPYYNGQPRLSARLTPEGDGSTIEGSFGAAPWHKAFFIFYFCFLTFLTFVWFASYLDSTDGNEFFGTFGWMPLAFWVAPFAFHFLFSMGWRADLEAIVTFLEEEADAHLVAAI